MTSKKQTLVVHDPYTAYIRQTLSDQGIPRHKQARIVARVVELKLVSVQQKFAGIRGWTRSQLILLEQHFGKPGSPASKPFTSDKSEHQRDASQWNAILKLSDAPQRCILQRGHALAVPEDAALAAIDESGAWVVVSGAKIPQGKVSFQVTHMTPLPAPRVAVLDDESRIADKIAALFSRQGIQASIFSDVESLLEVIRVQPFEAYILSWDNAAAATPESVIQHIRETQKSTTHITVLSGELHKQPTVVQDISRMVECYRVSVMEKPLVFEILGKIFYNILFGSSDFHSRK